MTARTAINAKFEALAWLQEHLDQVVEGGPEGTPRASISNDSLASAVILKFCAANRRNEYGPFVLVDSGADYCFFPRSR